MGADGVPLGILHQSRSSPYGKVDSQSVCHSSEFRVRQERRKQAHKGKVTGRKATPEFGAGRGQEEAGKFIARAAQRECKKSCTGKVGEEITTNSSRVASMQPGFFLCLNIFFHFFFKKRFAN
ncbi:MAG: hypothetical protein BWY14_01338 [Parcubacteria group bacterium ADurb.Bin192]|nr:MAG: hypothetical protein BWY14_01338 [Parcubacteria group bacterium ADurb.Bin192]